MQVLREGKVSLHWVGEYHTCEAFAHEDCPYCGGNKSVCFHEENTKSGQSLMSKLKLAI